MWRFVCDKCGISSAELNTPEELHKVCHEHVCPTDMWKDIIAFHLKFALLKRSNPGFVGNELSWFRIQFMQEELDEFIDAYQSGDLAAAADALVDLVYVVLGTAYLMGIPFNLCWNEVHKANMLKVRAKRESESKRGSTYDVIKPEGWVAPDLNKILDEEKSKCVNL